MTRYALRVDANQTQIVSALRAAGATVDIIGKPVDLLVGFRGKIMLVECKVQHGKRNPRAAHTTPAQDAFFARWDGYPIALVDSPESALRALNVLAA